MNHQSLEEGKNGKLQIWYCHECGCVHLRTTNVCMDFTKKEFADLTKAAIEIYDTNVAPQKKISPEITASHDEVLESEIVR